MHSRVCMHNLTKYRFSWNFKNWVRTQDVHRALSYWLCGPNRPIHVRGSPIPRPNNSLTFEFRKCLSYNQILNRSNLNTSDSNASRTSLWNLFWNILNMTHIWYIWRFGTNVQFRAYNNLQGLVHLTICMKFFEFSGSK